MTAVVKKNPRTLEPHPEIQDFPRWARDSDDFAAFCRDIAEHGIQDPLRVTPDDLVVDGETRRQAALAIGLDQVPCIVIPETEGFTTILRYLLCRRNLTKSGKAYLAYPLFETAKLEARARSARNLRKGSIPRSGTECHFGNLKGSEEGGKAEFCSNFGISGRMFRYAGLVHDLFHQDPAYRAQMLPEIFEHGVGLGAVVAGHAGWKATAGKERPPTQHFALFERNFRGWSKWNLYWDRLDSDDRGRVLTSLREQLATVPPDIREEMRKELRRLSRTDS